MTIIPAHHHPPQTSDQTASHPPFRPAKHTRFHRQTLSRACTASIRLRQRNPTRLKRQWSLRRHSLAPAELSYPNGSRDTTAASTHPTTMTRREIVAERHGSAASSGADSWKSTDTVKGPSFAGPPQRRGTPVRITTGKEQRYVPSALLSADGIACLVHLFANAICDGAVTFHLLAVKFDGRMRPCLHFVNRG